MTKEALTLALEALEDIGDEWGFTSQRTVPKRKEAITAIKEALANEALKKMAENARELGLDYEPPQRKPQIWEHEGYDALCQELELWKAEAQRKPLTDEELQPIADEYRILFGSWVKDFAQAIETKLRSKNNG